MGEGVEGRLFVVVVVVVVRVLVWMLWMWVGEGLWGLLGIGGLLRLLLLIRRRPWFVCECVGSIGLEVFVVEKIARSRCVRCRKVDDDGLMLNARAQKVPGIMKSSSASASAARASSSMVSQHHHCDHLPRNINLNRS